MESDRSASVRDIPKTHYFWAAGSRNITIQELPLARAEKNAIEMNGLDRLMIEVYFYNQSATDKLLLQAAIFSDAAESTTSSVITLKRTKWAGPKAVEIATSAASRPRAITMRPIRG